MKQKSQLKILFIQVREEEIRQHEFDLIVEQSGLSADQFTVFNAITDPAFDLSKLDKYDAVFMGGSGGYSVLDNAPFELYIESITRYCREHQIPYFGLCFGFQVAVQALGGVMINDLEHKETGTYKMYKTSESAGDPLMETLPQEFNAACGHQDRAASLPEGMVNLAYSDNCPFQIATYPNSTFYVIQFHPELWKRDDNLKRLYYYKDKFGLEDELVKEMETLFSDTPETSLIISRFIDSIVLPNT